MRVLLIGGTSSVAKALKPRLAMFNEVITAGRKNCDITLDLADPVEKMVFPDQIDVAIHTAAYFGGKTTREIFDAENINVLGTLKMCQLANQSGAKHFVYISSIFSSALRGTPNYNAYALSKKHGEEIAELYCHSCKLPLTVLRPSQLYGNEKSFEQHQPFFYNMVDKAQKGQDIHLYGSNDPIRNYIHIEDLVSVIERIIQASITGNYSCAYPNDTTYCKIARAAYAAFNAGGKVMFLKEKPDIPDSIYDKSDQLYKKISFYPQISINEGMMKLAKYRNSVL